ncbi:helix-turn-helix domain-containing protein [Gracilimonas sp.]|uniref:helix-turn-helix domain-containing protein n=1 Tax=Gracilimonas sp. TaxID=1974203 RepID=UPI003BAA52DD
MGQQNRREIIASNIKRYRNELGYTQEDLASYLSVSRTAITHYENNTRNIPIAYLGKIAALFGISKSDLLEEDQSKLNTKLAFAFRAEDLSADDLEEIASFKRIVLNYQDMQSLYHE